MDKIDKLLTTNTGRDKSLKIIQNVGKIIRLYVKDKGVYIRLSAFLSYSFTLYYRCFKYRKKMF